MSEAASVMRTPRHVDIEITPRCNLRCRYCYRGGMPSAPELDTGEWGRFIAELGACAVMTVCLAGGEPFLRADLPELLAAIARNRMRFSILSNGTLVDERAAAAVAESGRCDLVQVSLDAGRPEGHDSFRGAGSFAAAVRGAHLLLRSGVKVTARLTVHRRNVEELAEAVPFLLEVLGVSSVSTNAAGALGACVGAGEEVLLTATERQRAMATLTALAERYPQRLTATAGPLAEAREWSRMEAARRSGAPPFAEGGCLSGCGCSRQQLAVRADGSFVPCLLLPALELGRVNRDSLGSVWLDAPLLQALRRRRRLRLSAFAGCAACAYEPYCTGNCPAALFAAEGRLDAPAPEACLRRFLAAGGEVT